MSWSLGTTNKRPLVLHKQPSIRSILHDAAVFVLQEHFPRLPFVKILSPLNPNAWGSTTCTSAPRTRQTTASSLDFAAMSPPDKRGAASSSKGPKHVFQGGSPRKEVPASSSTSTARIQSDSSPSPEGPPRTPHASMGAPTSNGARIPAEAFSSTEAGTKEKDKRIASLERELSAMETEFKRELDKLSQSESETASFWQAKHSALNQQFLRTDMELRLLKEEIRAREADTEAASRGWRDALEMELKQKNDEIRDLKAQVRGLKEWVSASTRADGTTSDEVFGAGIANLGNGLQNWVITNFRKSKIDLSKANEASLQELAELVPMYEELAQTAKVHLLQSVVSRILVQRIFRSYFVGLSPEQELQLRQTEALLESFGKWFLCRLFTRLQRLRAEASP